MLSKFLRREKGITGLETAIILIAFVVVASVFAYTALSAGLFSTQKSSEAVYSGLKEAQSTLELKGGVIAKASEEGANGRVKQLSFIVANVLGGEPVDFTPPAQTGNSSGTSNITTSTNVIVINYQDEYQAVDNLYWTVSKLGNADADYLLEDNERFEITIGSTTDGSDGGNLIDALGTDLDVKTIFNLEVLTPVGAVLMMQRTTPAYMDPIMNLR